MTYEEAITAAKSIKLDKPGEIRAFVLRIRDQELVDQVCAKWFSIVCREIKYLPEIEPPLSYTQMVSAQGERNDVWKAYAREPEVKMYMEAKLHINETNLGNFHRIVTAVTMLHPKETVAKRELLDKMVEFINGTTNESVRPYAGFEFYNQRQLDKYGIKPKRKIQANSSDIQRGVHS